MSDITTITVVNDAGEDLNPVTATVTVIGTVPAGPPGADGSGSGLVDGDYGDVVVSGTGTVMTVEASIARDSEVTAAVAAEAALARNADNLTSGTVADARIASTIARDSEVSAAVSAHEADTTNVHGIADTSALVTTSALTELVQDIAGAMATDGTTVNFTYDDTAGTLTAEVQGLTSASLSDFAEAVRDRLGSTLVAGAGVSVTVDDPGDTVTVASTVTQYTDEMARDALGAALVAGNNVDITVDDNANTITIDVEALTTADLSDFATAVDERARDALGAALVAGTNVTITPDDVANTITIDATGGSSYTDENAQDAVGGILADSGTIDFTYTDATPEITAVVKDGSITAAKVAADVATQAELDAVAGTIPNTEAIQDVVGGMVSGGTETGIAVTYDDTNGRLDFVAEVTQSELDAVESDLATAIADGDASTLTSAQTYADGKVSDTAYNESTWNAVTGVAPSKNAVRDQIEALASIYIPKTLADANSILYATADDTPAALAIAANKFPARSSSGNIVAKDITDFALSLLDDANAAAVLATITPAAIVTALTGAVGGLPVTKVKTANESVTSSTAVQDDDDLFFAIGANETWVFEMYLFTNAATAGDFRFAITTPTGATQRYGRMGLDDAATAFNADLEVGDSTASGAEMVIGGPGGTGVSLVFGFVANGANAGDVKLRWAQGTSSGTASILAYGSHLHARRVA